MPRNSNFYEWDFIRYFLYEYEESLRESSKSSTRKISWENLCMSDKDFRTVEHIYPQRGRDTYWVQGFKKYEDKEKALLRHTIGNLVPLSQAKNSSLSNKPFPEKIDNQKDKVGYRYGSFSENELTIYKDWTAKEILNRSVKLIKFMSKRWKINFGDTNEIVKLLQLEFVLKKEGLEIKGGKILDK